MTASTPKWLLFTSGRGPAECRLAVQGMVGILLKEHAASVLLDVVEDDDGHGWLSALVSIDGDMPACKDWVGTLQWLCPSPLRAGHQRKRWYVGVSLLVPPESTDTSVQPRDLAWEAMRASGPGGQHVNKTESAVRLTHLPTGLVVVAREERSQHRNRALALSRLGLLLREGDRHKKAAGVQEQWAAHDALERGNPVTTFKGLSFSRT